MLSTRRNRCFSFIFLFSWILWQSQQWIKLADLAIPLYAIVYDFALIGLPRFEAAKQLWSGWVKFFNCWPCFQVNICRIIARPISTFNLNNYALLMMFQYFNCTMDLSYFFLFHEDVFSATLCPKTCMEKQSLVYFFLALLNQAICIDEFLECNNKHYFDVIKRSELFHYWSYA